MPTPDVRVKDLVQSYAPLESLAQAIGSMLTSAVSKKQAASTTLSSLVSKALHQILEATPSKPQRPHAADKASGGH